MRLGFLQPLIDACNLQSSLSNDPRRSFLAKKTRLKFPERQ